MMQISANHSVHSGDLPHELSRSEISRIIRLEDITPVANTILIEANVRECMALAVRFDLTYVRSLSAELTYRRVRGGTMIRIDGRITATYGQTCGVSLASMPMTMEESFQTEYTLSAWEKYSEFDLDQPEILTDDFIDMGDVAAQYFGLAIDPFAQRTAADTLPELAQYLSSTVQELMETTAAPPDSAAASLAVAPMEEPAVMLGQAEIEAVLTENAEVIEFVTQSSQIVPTAFAVPEVALIPAATHHEPAVEPDAETAELTHAVTAAEPEPIMPQESEPEEQPYESLFMKYLRQIRAA